MSDNTSKSHMNKLIFRIALVAAAILAFALSTNAKLDSPNEIASQTTRVVNTINARHYLPGTIAQPNDPDMF